MLLLVFYLGEEKYLIKHDSIREISPMVMLKTMPHMPDYFAGFFNYRGQVVPVIDLCQFIQGYPCKMRLSTRIMLVDYVKANQPAAILGLMAERLTEAIRKPEATLIFSGSTLPQSPYWEGFILERDKMIPCLNLKSLLKQLYLDTEHVSTAN
jgi:chemotaxis-related protein WspB